MNNKLELEFIEKAYNEGNLPECDYIKYKEQLTITAKDLFKNINFKNVNDWDSYPIFEHNEFGDRFQVRFDGLNKNITLQHINHKIYGIEMTIDLFLLKAIYKQIEELGWFNVSIAN